MLFIKSNLCISSRSYTPELFVWKVYWPVLLQRLLISPFHLPFKLFFSTFPTTKGNIFRDGGFDAWFGFIKETFNVSGLHFSFWEIELKPKVKRDQVTNQNVTFISSFICHIQNCHVILEKYLQKASIYFFQAVYRNLGYSMIEGNIWETVKDSMKRIEELHFLRLKTKRKHFNLFHPSNIQGDD